MQKARLMDTAEDFKKLGVNPDKVELWEEGRRTTGASGENEVWYFDGTMEDGSKFIVAFRPKEMMEAVKPTDSPNTNIVITAPDGRKFADFHHFIADEGYTGTTNGCDCRYGSDWCRGDLKSYDLHFEPTNGVGADLHYEALCEPFRQGTGIIAFGDNDEFYHTDIPVPKCRVTGCLYYDGKTVEVSGLGYHDHQWMNTAHMTLYHHWLWGRMYTDKFTVYIYDFVAANRYGYKQLPFFGVIDNESGKVVFSTDGNFTLDTTLEPEANTGREFPKRSHYVFSNKDGRQAILDIEWEQQIELTDYYAAASEAQRKAWDQLDIHTIYTRYYAKGSIQLTTPADNTGQCSNGDMIYEYAYIQNPNPAAHV